MRHVKSFWLHIFVPLQVAIRAWLAIIIKVGFLCSQLLGRVGSVAVLHTNKQTNKIRDKAAQQHRPKKPRCDRLERSPGTVTNGGALWPFFGRYVSWYLGPTLNSMFACSNFCLYCKLFLVDVTVTVAERGHVGKGVKENPTPIWPYLWPIWPYLCGILFNSFPNFSSNFTFFVLSHTNSWVKMCAILCNNVRPRG